MKKNRIVKREFPDGTFKYVIQLKHWLFPWKWVDGWRAQMDPHAKDSFHTLEEAKKGLSKFDGAKPNDTIVY